MKFLARNPRKGLVRKAVVQLTRIAITLLPVLLLATAITSSGAAQNNSNVKTSILDEPLAQGASPPWYEPPQGIHIEEDPSHAADEFGRFGAQYYLNTSVVQLNHPPQCPSQRIPVQVSVGQNAIIDLSAINDPDGHLLQWDFSYHDAFQVSWNQPARILEISFSQQVGATAQVVVDVQDLKDNGMDPRGGQCFTAIDLERVP